MKCSECNEEKGCLTEIFCVESQNVPKMADFADDGPWCPFQRLCGQCIVGHDIPVYRNSIKQWHVGEVKVFDRENMRHLIEFLDTESEWVTLDCTPAASYLSSSRTDSHKQGSRPSCLDTNALLGRCQNEEWTKQEFGMQDLHSDEIDSIDTITCARDCLPSQPTNFKVAPETQGMSEQPSDTTVLTTSSRNLTVNNQPTFPERGEAFIHSSMCQQPRGTSVFLKSPMPGDRNFLGAFNAGDRTTTLSDLSWVNNTIHNLEHRSRKPGPRMWSLEEDRLLFHIVERTIKPVKWPLVANSIPGRTAKQCRERYLNHLKPKIKVEEWTPVEDALIFHLHRSYGSKWSKMTKMLRGRTDNSIKNRFHHIRRRIEKDLCSSSKRSRFDKLGSKARAWKNVPSEEEKNCEVLMKIRDVLPHVAAVSLLNEDTSRYGYTFGPFRDARAEGEMCARCQLVAPSVQTGSTMCERSGWCASCTRVAPYVSGDTLRECLHLRTCLTTDVDATARGPPTETKCTVIPV